MSAATDLLETLREQSRDLAEPVVSLPEAALPSRRGPMVVPAEKLHSWLEVSITVHNDPWSSTEEVLQVAANDIVRDPMLDDEQVNDIETSLEQHGHNPQDATDIAAEWLTGVAALRTLARSGES